MSENLNLAFQLLLVGMVSVFFILGIVVGLGRLLIFAVNKLTQDILERPSTKILSSDTQNVAIVTAVTELVTQGKGVIKSITKI